MFKSLMAAIMICGGIFFICTKIYEKVKCKNSRELQTHKSNGLSNNYGTIEKRQHPRIKTGLPLLIFSNTLTGAIPATSGDMSISGAFIKCDASIEIGEFLKIEFLNETRLPVMTAQVVWSNSGVPQDRVLNRGIGVRFSNVSFETRKALELILSAS